MLMEYEWWLSFGLELVANASLTVHVPVSRAPHEEEAGQLGVALLRGYYAELLMLSAFYHSARSAACLIPVAFLE